VLLGATSEAARAQESLKLLNWGFQSFDSVRLYKGGEEVKALEVWKGAAKTVKAGVRNDLLVAVPKGEAEKLKAEMVTQQPLVAPFAKDQRIGTLKVSFEGNTVGEYPLLALEPVAQAGIFGRAWDTLRLWLK
jgi:D-alanyl-D-alanine carboxypeptidase (penicillin-binding protein 5/6)